MVNSECSTSHECTVEQQVLISKAMTCTCALYILVPLQNNNVKSIHSKLYGECRQSCTFLSLCDIFVGVQDPMPFDQKERIFQSS